MRSSVLSVAPTEMPVSVDELKMRVRYSDSDYDSVFMGYLLAAVEYCQEYQWAQYCTATYIDKFDRFTQPLMLLRSPVQSVSSVQYVDTGGTTRTLTDTTDYVVDTNAKPCRLVPSYAKWWPATRGHINDVTVTYVAGYGSPSDVPDEIKQAILLKAAQQYEACDSPSMDKVISALLDKRSYRLFY